MYRNFDPVLLDRKEVHVKQQSPRLFRHCLPLSQPAVWCSHRHSPFGLLVHLFGAQQLRQGEARPGCQTTDDHGTIVKWKASDLGLLGPVHMPAGCFVPYQLCPSEIPGITSRDQHVCSARVMSAPMKNSHVGPMSA